MNKVFFVSYGGGHGNIVKYIYKQLQLTEDFQANILALTASVRIFDEAGIPYKTYVDYLDFIENKDRIKEIGEQLAKKEYDKTSGLPYEQIAAYLGVGYYNALIDNNMDEHITQEKFSKYGRTIFCPIHTMSEILRYENPDVVVLTTDVRSEKAAGIVANNLGIPVVRVIDLVNVLPVPYRSTLCVMNQLVKDILLNRKEFIQSNIIVTGQPVFEYVTQLDQEKCQMTEQYFYRENYKHVIIYLESPQYRDQEKLEPEIRRLAKKNPRNLYIIKLHPNQKLLTIKNKPKNLCIEQRYELKYLLNMCDLAITGISTSGLEAAFLGKPLIVSNLCGNKNSQWDKYGIAIKITTTEELENAILTCLDKAGPVAKALEEGRRKFQNHQNASQNIVKVIKNVIDTKHIEK